ncbi:MAG: Gfo/Idh/MocA family protein [Armatimonadota bacterium]
MPRPTVTSRRRFLKGSAAAAGAAGIGFPTIVPARALGAEPGVPAASERILIGHIGVGGQGRGNMRPHLKNTVAVCDVDRAHLAQAKAQVEAAGNPCEAYSDFRKLLENKDVDAVVITTPDHWHALPTLLACEAGKDVYVEKPLSLTIDEGKAMIRAARRHRRIVQTGSQQRSDAKFRQACELVRSGRLGKIHTVRVGLPGVNFTGPAVMDGTPPEQLDYDFWLGPAPLRPYNEKRVHYLFRFFWDYSGGQLTNWGAHHLDIAQWGLGMDESGPVSCEGTAKFHAESWYEVPEQFGLTFQYANGVTMLCGQQYRGGTQFEGEHGWIWVDRGKIEASAPELLTDPLPGSATRLYASDNHHQNWLDCIKSRKSPICDVEIGHRSATVCHLGNLALRSGRKVRWDPKKQKVVGDPEQQRMTRYAYRSPWKLEW